MAIGGPALGVATIKQALTFIIVSVTALVLTAGLLYYCQRRGVGT